MFGDLRTFLHATCLRVCLLALFLSLAASNMQATGGEPYFHLKLNDGLPSDVVYACFQDSEGYVWFGTDNGIASFDGYEFKRYGQEQGLPDLDIFGFYEDGAGRLWLRSYNGSLCFLQGGKVFHPGNLDLLARHKFSGHITDIKEDSEGNLFIGNIYEGIIKINLAQNTSQLISTIGKEKLSRLNYFYTSANSHLIGQFGHGRIDLSEGKVLDTNEFGGTVNRRGLFLNEQWQLFVRNDSVFNLKGNQFLVKTGFAINALQHTRDDAIWISTNRGLFEAKVQKTNLKLQRSLFADQPITGIFEDLDGGIWVSTLTNGAYYVPEREIQYWSTSNGLPDDYITCLDASPDGQLYMGFNGCASSRIEQDGKSVLLRNKNQTQGDGHAWLFPSNGLAVYVADDSLLIYRDKKVIGGYRGSKSAILLRNGKLAIGHASGLSLLDLDSLLTQPEKLVGSPKVLTSIRPSAIYENAKGQIYLGSAQGIAIYDQGQTLHPDLPDSLAQKRVNAIASGNGEDIWVGTAGWGVYRFGKSPTISINVREGLAGGLVNSLYADEFGNIWVATTDGLSKITLVSEGGQEYMVTNFFPDDGLADGNVTDVVVRNHQVWAATKQGLCTFDERRIGAGRSVVRLKMLNAQINGRTQEPNAHLQLGAGKFDIQFNWAGINFRNRKRITYRYRLAGWETEWREGSNPSAYYEDIPGGEYQFELTAFLAPNGAPSPKLSVKVSIAPAYYQRPLFWVFLILGLLLLGLGYSFWRRRRKEAREVLASATLDEAESTDPVSLTEEKANTTLPASNTNKETFMFVKSDGLMVKVMFDDIQYLQSSGHYIQIHTAQHRLMTLSTMQAMLEKLSNDDNFVRVHRSYIISLKHVSKVQGNVVMIGKSEIPIGGSYKEALMAALGLDEG